jgi:hypothetical protein
MEDIELQDWVGKGEASMPDGICDGRGSFQDRGPK